MALAKAVDGGRLKWKRETLQLGPKVFLRARFFPPDQRAFFICGWKPLTKLNRTRAKKALLKPCYRP